MKLLKSEKLPLKDVVRYAETQDYVIGYNIK